MFYILNFVTHQFTSCDSLEDACKKVELLISITPETDIEIINGNLDGARLSVSEFRNLAAAELKNFG